MIQERDSKTLTAAGRLFVAIVMVVVLLIAVCSGPARAQTYVGGGIKVTRTTNTDATYPGGYVEGGLKLPANFQARLLAEFSPESELATIFTRDLNSERKATSEIRFRPTLRYNAPYISGFRPFVESGVDIYRQNFTGVGADCYGGHCGYGQAKLSKAGLNPLLGAGVHYKSYEGAYTRIFADQGSWNISRLEGHRLGASYERPLYGRIGLKVAGEADFVSFREAYGRYTDYYREYDNVFRVRVGFTFGGGQK